MPRKADPNRKLRAKLNLTIHPEIRIYADELALKRRRSISQLFEDLIEAEWIRLQSQPLFPQPAPQQPPQPAPMPTPYYYAPAPVYAPPTA
jgi:hypothetical protein